MNRKKCNTYDILLIFIICFFSIACRFTVREIGFADIFPEPYRLYFFYENKTSEEHISIFRDVTSEVFINSNVTVKVVNTDDSADFVAKNYFEKYQNNKLPFVIFVAPEGYNKILTFDSFRGNFKNNVKNVLKETISSPTRNSILNELVERFAIVLLIEGKNPDENNLARKKLVENINEIRNVMFRMPKVVKEPPKLFCLSQDKCAEEKTLLWSLGINLDKSEQPVAAVFYGRGRRMGDIINFNEIKKNSIFRLMTLIGADCECGLDRKWLLGKMIPLSWNDHLQKKLVENIGFDVENPLIKTEMSQIVTKETQRTSSFQDNLFEPKEYDLATDIVPHPEDTVINNVPEISFEQVQENQIKNKDVGTSIGTVLGPTIILSLIIMGIGFFILIRSKQNR
jgi:hypothetical protein